MLTAINIKWDTDGNVEVFNKLPTEMKIPYALEKLYEDDEEYALDGISNWLSDEIGFCHNGFEIKKVITKESIENELYNFFKNKMTSGDVPEIEKVGHYERIHRCVRKSSEYIAKDKGIVIKCVGGEEIILTIQVR